jgi:hypothetical protein
MALHGAELLVIDFIIDGMMAPSRRLIHATFRSQEWQSDDNTNGFDAAINSTSSTRRAITF